MQTNRRTMLKALIGSAVLAQSAISHADVDLVTIPTREGVQLTIYNSADITMVREHRLLTLKKGINRIQFSWVNTLIDPTSIEIRLLDNEAEVDLLDTTFPSGRNDALQWNIDSQVNGKVPVEIRYFTSGVTWKADYVGIANQDETKIDLTGYIRVHNNSGELYDNANVRLVVGKINLVEEIAALAQRPAPDPTKGFKDADDVVKEQMRRGLVEKADNFFRAKRNGQLKPGGVLEDAAQVKKQGLSEYFLFSVGGREEIRNNEPKRMVAMDIKDVPLEVIYKLSDRVNQNAFTKYYRFKNEKLKQDDGSPKKLDDMANLGVAPLPDGAVRLFSQYENKDLAYVGGTNAKYIPIGDRLEVSVGFDPDITNRKVIKDEKISEVVARQKKRRLDNTYVMYYDLIDYHHTYFFEEEIVCGKAVATEVEVERAFGADVRLWANDDKPVGWDENKAGAYVDMRQIPGRVEIVDQRHVKFFAKLQPGERKVIKYQVTYKYRDVGPELNQEKRREPI